MSVSPLSSHDLPHTSPVQRAAAESHPNNLETSRLQNEFSRRPKFGIISRPVAFSVRGCAVGVKAYFLFAPRLVNHASNEFLDSSGDQSPTAKHDLPLPSSRQRILFFDMSKPRILLAMITAGNGHKAPADALKSGFEKLYPGVFEIDVLDFAGEIGDTIFDNFTKNTWNWMLRNPWSAYYGQLLLEWVVPREITRWVTARMLRHHARNAAFFVRNRYDLLVSTHYFTVQALSDARRKFGVTVPLVGIVTDPFDGHVLWADEHADELIVNSPRAKRSLERSGVKPERVSIYGYPLGLQFVGNKQNRADSRRELGLHADQLTILQSAGGEGLGGQLEAFVRAVLTANLDVQYVVACGRNEQLLERLLALKAEFPHAVTTLEPRGYISNMHTYLSASDVVLGKAGASTTLEALATGHPMFHTSFVNQSEKTNVEFCAEHRVGKYIPQPDDLVATLTGFLAHPAQLEALRENVKALELEVGTLEIARHLVEKYLYYAVPSHSEVVA